jgi:hypothetical protein
MVEYWLMLALCRYENKAGFELISYLTLSYVNRILWIFGIIWDSNEHMKVSGGTNQVVKYVGNF